MHQPDTPLAFAFGFVYMGGIQYFIYVELMTKRLYPNAEFVDGMMRLGSRRLKTDTLKPSNLKP